MSTNHLRHLCLRLHRYTGVVLALLILFAALTGSLLVFSDELDAWVNRDLVSSSPAAPPLPLLTTMARVERQIPGLRVVALNYRQSQHGVWLFSVRPKRGQVLPFDQVWVDAHTGQVLAQRQYRPVQLLLDRRHLLPSLHVLHENYMFGRNGTLLAGWVALLWLASSLLGLYLSRPHQKEGHFILRWGKLLLPRANRRWVRRWFDWHRLCGLYSLPIVLLICFSGAYFNLDFLFRPILKHGFTQAVWPTRDLPLRHMREPVLAVEDAQKLALQTYPDAKLVNLRFDYGHGLYQFGLSRPGDLGRTPDTYLMIAMDEAKILARWEPQMRGSADSFAAWQLPLHSGQILGLAGRILWLCAGLAVCVLVVAGLVLYWLRREARIWAAAHRAQRSQEW